MTSYVSSAEGIRAGQRVSGEPDPGRDRVAAAGTVTGRAGSGDAGEDLGLLSLELGVRQDA